MIDTNSDTDFESEFEFDRKMIEYNMILTFSSSFLINFNISMDKFNRKWTNLIKKLSDFDMVFYSKSDFDIRIRIVINSSTEFGCPNLYRSADLVPNP